MFLFKIKDPEKYSAALEVGAGAKLQ